ncbi:MAG: hypothetical protein F6J99_43120 [Moorea sp. SIO4G3]|nr:hypothetical protein [Moorena sp. SIO4G3]
MAEKILSTRRISRFEQEQFMAALLAKNYLTEMEEAQVNQVFDGLRSGSIDVLI